MSRAAGGSLTVTCPQSGNAALPCAFDVDVGAVVEAGEGPSPSRRVARFEAILDWFDRYVR